MKKALELYTQILHSIWSWLHKSSYFLSQILSNFSQVYWFCRKFLNQTFKTWTSRGCLPRKWDLLHNFRSINKLIKLGLLPFYMIKPKLPFQVVMQVLNQNMDLFFLSSLQDLQPCNEVHKSNQSNNNNNTSLEFWKEFPNQTKINIFPCLSPILCLN